MGAVNLNKLGILCSNFSQYMKIDSSSVLIYQMHLLHGNDIEIDTSIYIHSSSMFSTKDTSVFKYLYTNFIFRGKRSNRK